MEFKVIISDGGKTYQKEIKGEEAARIVGLRIGEVFDGGLIGESGKLQVTGGTDKDGFPMKRGIPGSRRLKILMKSGPGFIPKVAGERRKKRVRGDTISEDTVQINTKVVEEKKKKVKAEAEEAEKEIEVKEAKPEVEKKVEEVKKVKEAKPKKVKEAKPKKPKKPKKAEKVEKAEKVKKEEKPPEAEERPIALIKVKGVGKVTADQLAAAGIASVQEFLAADVTHLAKKTGLPPAKIEKLKAQAQELVG